MNFKKVEELVKDTERIVFNQELKNNIKMKGVADFVTSIDLEINNYLKKALLNMDDNIAFFSEEENGSLKDVCWILDPIDGTTNLIYGYNMSTISLALYANKGIQFGIVYNPFTKECFTAERHKGAYLNGVSIHVSDRHMKEAIIEFGAGSTNKQNADINFEMAKNIFKNCIDIRRICSSALSICFIASGRIDGYFEQKLKPWDYAAASIILEEAGGKITDFDNNKIQFAKKTSIIASNTKIHKPIYEIISEYK